MLASRYAPVLNPNPGIPGASRLHQHGGTAVGFLVGLVCGLAVAAIVAIFVTRAPMPFVNKSDRVSAMVVSPQGGVLPDPNSGLQRGQPDPQAGAGQQQAPTIVANNAAQSSAVQPAQTVVPGSAYVLQAGAYRAEPDAQAMRARLALIGYEAQVRAAKINNETLYRVRIGPFNAMDQINAARAKLARDGVEATLIKQN